MSWDDEDFDAAVVAPTPAVAATGPKPTGAWDDEEAELLEGLTTAVAATKVAAPAAPTNTARPKHMQKKLLASEPGARKGEGAAAAAAGTPLADPIAERRRIEELQKNAELADFAESLGLGGTAAAVKGGGAGGAIDTTDMKALVAALPLGSPDSFSNLADMLVPKVHTASSAGTTPLKANEKATQFYKSMLSLAAASLSADELRELSLIIDAARNKKIAEARASKKGATTAAKKAAPKVSMGRADDYGLDGYDDYVPGEARGPDPADGDAFM